MKFYSLLPILSIITIFVINICHAIDITSSLKNKLTKKVKDNSNTTNHENYFMILVNNDSSKDGKNNKREEAEQHINDVINEITTLILDNIDTYKNPDKLEKFEQNSNLLRKRSNENIESSLAYTISSLDDRTIIYSYLSDVVADKVEEIPNVIACIEDRKIYLAGENENEMDQLENLNEILKETQWSGVSVRENADLHLSLLSQGKYDGNSTYDKNYYYPSSAGKDIDIFILDSGFNFRHPEYANKDERIVKCALALNNGIAYPSKNDDYCDFTYGNAYHGHFISDVVGGLVHGVASKANIYGIALLSNFNDESEYPTEYPSDKPYTTESGDDDFPTDFETDYPTDILDYPNIDYYKDPEKKYRDFAMAISNILAALKYIDKNMLRSNKAVFNLSTGYTLNQLFEKDQYLIDYWRDYIDHMTSKGAVFVASAGNESSEIKLNDKNSTIYPCAFDNVICVGAIDNAGMNILVETEKEINDLAKLMYKKGATEELTNKFLELYEIFYYEEVKSSKLWNEKIMDSENYRVASFSNYGKVVDIYAPGYVDVEYRDVYGRNIKKRVSGTSYSSPIVAGVAATIMSEHPDIKFDSKKMLEYLTEMGQKNIIEGILEGNPNVFVNNGKHSVYSGSNNDETKLFNEKVSDAIDEVETDDFIKSDIEIDDIINSEVDDLIDSEIENLIDSDVDDFIDSEVDEK
eukprot:jgi/Orpsp1_1/1183443/evm.model.c7180000085216.1